MKKTILFLILLILLVPITFAGGGDYLDYVTIGQGDLRWCKLYGVCTFNTITIDSLTVYNLSVIGDVFNVTMNLVTWNITDSFNVGGNLVAKNVTFDSLTVTNDIIANSFNGSWNGSVNYQLKLANSSNITCIENQCYYNGTDKDTVFDPSTLDYVNHTQLDNDTILRSDTDIEVNKITTYNISSPYANKSFIFFQPDGSVGITLDPIIPLVQAQEEIKVKETIKRTPSTETVCNNGKCHLVLYSGVRFVEEENEWKDIREAKSLKNSGIKCIVESDGTRIAVCDDFNYTHRKIKTSINQLSAIDKTKVPISVYYEKYNDETNETDTIEKSKEFYDFELIPNRDEWIKASYGDIIKVGDKSTTIKLQIADSENLDDNFVSEFEGSSNFGSLTRLEVRSWSTSGGADERTYIKFNISSIPVGVTIELANLFLFKITDTGSFPRNYEVHHVNSSWNEETQTWNNQPCGTDFDNSENCNLTAESTIAVSTTDGWYSWSVTNAVQTDYGNNKLNTSFAIKDETEDAGSNQEIRLHSKEYTGDTTLRPYLNISYIPPTISVSTNLTSPSDGSTDYDGNVTFECFGTVSNSNLDNITLYHNASGTWGANETNTSSPATFTINNIANNTNLIWNCLSSNDVTNTSFADANWTLTINIIPIKTPKFFIQDMDGTELWYVDYNGNQWLRNSLTIDTNTLYVDALKDRVGIGTTTPSHKLEVAGSMNVTNLNISNNFYADGNSYFGGGYGNTGATIYDNGNASFDGNITADNVFLPVYVSSHTNNTIAVASAGVWYNITFDHGEDEFKKRITHNPDDGTNTTFTIQDDGIYEITYTVSFEDSAIVPNSHIVTRVTKNNVELNGFTIETDLGIQNTEDSLHHSDLVELATGDKIVLSFTSDDTTVSLSSHLTYGIHKNTGHLTVKRIA